MKLDDIIGQTVFEQSPISTQIFSPEGYSVAANKAWEKLWGMKHTQIEGYNVLKDKELISNGVIKFIKEGFNGKATHIPPIKFEPKKHVNIQNAVDYRYVRGLIYPVKDKSGKIVQIVLHNEDITEQVENVQKNEEVNARFASIVENSDDAIVGKNLNGIITSWNKGAERIFGYSEKEAIGQHITLIIPMDLRSQEDEIISKIKQGKRVEHFETLRLRKDGRLINISITVSPIKNSQGKVIGASKIARDITERKRLEKLKDEFVGVASHELKTPVTSLRAYTQIIHQKQLKKGDLESANTLQKVLGQIDKLTELINDLLDITRIQEGKLEMRKDNFDLNGLVMEVVDDIQRVYLSHKISIKLDKTKELYADRDRVSQVLINLLTNAIKYSPQSDKIEVETKTSGKEIIVSVKDFGKGIPKEEQPRIFDKFYRVNGESNSSTSGLGLGLYISSEIIRRQNGQVWVESKLNQGSTFSFSLPINN